MLFREEAPNLRCRNIVRHERLADAVGQNEGQLPTLDLLVLGDRVGERPPLERRAHRAGERVEQSSDPSFRDSFAREFAVLASLSLPGVARVHSSFALRTVQKSRELPIR